ncbi:MAG: hypothetical protein JXQ76_06205 [Campylobacterales bacterium]|nr:hypothetical protein [Campylobacterales bacterium]
MDENQNSKNRRIIYVDASFDNETKEAKIGLYDKENNKLDRLLIKKANSSNEAEKYAILYACLYVKKKGITDRKIHILNDNYAATQDEQILKVCQYLQVGISWIPREINEVADKGSKLEVNVKEKESNLLELFYDILINDALNKPKNNTMIQQNTNVDFDDKEKNILLNAVKECNTKNKPHVTIGQVGNYLKKNNPNYKYKQLKKSLKQYPNEFEIVNDDVKLK